MVNKHGRNKKRRAGRLGKTKLKAPIDYTKRPKIKDPILRKYWDASKSTAANLQSMGILHHPNNGLSTGKDGDEFEAFNKSIQNNINSNTEAAKAIFERPMGTKPKRVPLSKEDQEYIATCFAKHGDNYTAMFRDIKDVNRMQHTEQRLSKMGTQFLSMDSKLRVVPVPENVKHLATSEDDEVEADED